MSLTVDHNQPHRRRNPLTGEWVLVSPQRMDRPWRGQVEATPPESLPQHDPACYLCPGNARASGEANPRYEGVHVFTNDYPALLPEAPPSEASTHPLMQAQPVRGASRVVCFSPRHDLTLPSLPVAAIRRVVDVWAAQVEELGARYRWVQVFQNKGRMMGASNLHPHGQIWAGDWLPEQPAKEDAAQRLHYAEHGRVLLLNYAALEMETGERVVLSNEHWLAVVPFWAVWPFEVLLVPHKRRISHLPDLTAPEREALASILKRLLTKYDNLFETRFPYSMGWHGVPSGSPPGQAEHWQLHAHFYPPLLRSATVRKFLVGYEMLAEPQRDLTAEAAAARMRSLPEVHYRERA